MLWEDTGELARKRPEQLGCAIAAKFAEQETAGKALFCKKRSEWRRFRQFTSRGRDKKYGAVGSLEASVALACLRRMIGRPLANARHRES